MLQLRNVVFIMSCAAWAAPGYGQGLNRIIGRAETVQRAEDATALRNGDIAFAGSLYDFSTNEGKVAIIRTWPDGTPIWDLILGTTEGFDDAFGIREFANTRMVVGIHSGYDANALCAAGIDATGNILWKKRYPGSGASRGSGMEVETGPGGDFAVIANSYVADGLAAGQLLRLNATDGSVGFNFAYAADPGIVSEVFFGDVAMAPGGDYFVTGGVTFFDADLQTYDTDVLAARIDRSGNVIWSVAYGVDLENAQIYEYGAGIELTAAGKVAIVGRTSDPVQQYGPPAALHLLLDPASGALLASNVLPDVQVASASLDRLLTGQLVASGSRTFGDGGTQAQMWLVNPSDMTVYWRAEYGGGSTSGTDAIEHLAPHQGLVLTGSNSASPTPPIGYSDTLFVRTDTSGNAGCDAQVWFTDPVTPTLKQTPVTLARATLAGVSDYVADSVKGTPQVRDLCVSINNCPCDLNGDGVVDDADFVIFVFAYNTLDCADPAMPAGCPSDFNHDGVVDDSDFVVFVLAYDDLVCP